MTTYTYGSTVIHDGINYFLQAKSKNMAPVATATFKASRQEGTKKTGDTVNDVPITVSTIIAGSSRAQLLNLLDTLYAGLAKRQQYLSIHDTDSRYYICDCVEANTTLQVGHLLYAVVAMKFVAYQPFAIGGSVSTYSVPDTTPSYVSGYLYTTGAVDITVGGNIYTRPVITFVNSTPTNASALATGLTNGNNYTSLALNAALPNAVLNGDRFILNDGAGHTQTVIANGNQSAGITTLAVNSFTANFSYPATTTTVTKDTSFTSVAIIQNNDGQTITFSGLTGFTSGHSFTINCDPTGTNGWTGLLDGAGSPWSFTGVFPVLEPGDTNIEFQIDANSSPVLQVNVSWYNRWLA